MRVETIITRRNVLTTGLRDLMSRSLMFSFTHEQELEARQKLFESYNYAKLPYYAKSYLSGIYDQLSQERYHTNLVFGCYIEGKFYSAHRDRADYYEKQGKSARIYADESNNGTRGHYWAHTLKPFFLSHTKGV